MGAEIFLSWFTPNGGNYSNSTALMVLGSISQILWFTYWIPDLLGLVAIASANAGTRDQWGKTGLHLTSQLSSLNPAAHGVPTAGAWTIASGEKPCASATRKRSSLWLWSVALKEWVSMSRLSKNINFFPNTFATVDESFTRENCALFESDYCNYELATVKPWQPMHKNAFVTDQRNKGF